MKRKLLSILALLMTAATGAWADSFSTTPYSSNVTLSGVTVSSDMTITINSGVTVTVNNGLNISSGTLTVVGDGTLRVNGAGGGIAVKGNIIVQGATVKAYGGTGSTGSTGYSPGHAGYGQTSNGGNGGNGGTGGAAFSGAVVIYSGQIVAQGGTGGRGGNGGNGGSTSGTLYNGGNGGNGGTGGTGGTAFTSTLTIYGGNVDAIGGTGGSGGSGGSGGTSGSSWRNGSAGSSGGSGSVGSAFSNASNLIRMNTADTKMYSDANKTTQIYSVSGRTIYITAPNAVPSLTLSEATDNSVALADNDGLLVANISLTRTLQTGGWNTFSVPFSIAKPSGWTVKELTDASFEDATNTLSLTFGDAESIVAGHAYLVQVESAVVNPTFNYVTIVNDPKPTTISGVVEFVPAINPTALTLDDKSCLFVSGGNSLTWASSGSSMNGFRAYFHILDGSIANARAFSMGFGDEETVIIGVTANERVTDGAVYTLDGRKLNGQPTQKGVYVVNGKKVIIK